MRPSLSFASVSLYRETEVVEELVDTTARLMSSPTVTWSSGSSGTELSVGLEAVFLRKISYINYVDENNHVGKYVYVLLLDGIFDR